MYRILILEDDRSLAAGIERALSAEEREFVLCFDISAARQAVRSEQFHLLILDVSLPDGSGLDFCREVRSFLATPILFLTANDTEMDIVLGLETGADDYITKPFSLAILRARVSALLRRFEGKSQEISCGDLQLDFEGLCFTKKGRVIELSRTEQRLLHMLAKNIGQTVTRERLLEYIWPDGTEYVDENALSVAISRLRSKLEDDPANPRYIKTVRGLGYSMAVVL